MTMEKRAESQTRDAGFFSSWLKPLVKAQVVAQQATQPVVLAAKKATRNYICGHFERKHHARNRCKNCYSTAFVRIKKTRYVKLSCGHFDSPHCAKGLCRKCYDTSYYSKKGWRPRFENSLCGHLSEKHYAKGLCKQCYGRAAYLKKQGVKNEKL
jgi:hypothetical protein